MPQEHELQPEKPMMHSSEGLKAARPEQLHGSWKSGKIDISVKCFPCKHGDLSLIDPEKSQKIAEHMVQA